MKVRKLFDQCATVYDHDRQKLVPSFDELYGTAVRVIPFSSEAKFSVLDLGAGTGLLAEMISQAFPAAHLHLTDISEAMLMQARQRFACNQRVKFSLQEHTQLSARSAYDLVVSALSIHHLESRDKQHLFHKIFHSLRPGGMFINIDQALAPSSKGERQYENWWIEDAKANDVTELALVQAQERMQEDKNAMLSDQLLWLAEAGFHEVDCWYKRFRFVVYGGSKNIEKGAVLHHSW